MISGRRMNLVLLVLAIIGFVPAFVGRADPYLPRSLHALWDIGHIPLFFILTLLLLRLARPLAAASFSSRVSLCCGLALLAGLLLEYLQTFAGREASLLDIGNDLLGSALAVVYRAHQLGAADTRRLRLWTLVLVMTFAGLNHRLFVYVFDEIMAHRQFPVLVDFSTPFETGRIGGNALSAIEVHDGHARLRVNLDTAQYSGFALDHFPRDWRQYSLLELLIVNPDPRPLRITCRIHDTWHSDGNEEYTDRFNSAYQLSSGANHIYITLDEVAAAPAGRRLDLSSVGGLGCFTTALDEPRELLLEEIRLGQTPPPRD